MWRRKISMGLIVFSVCCLVLQTGCLSQQKRPTSPKPEALGEEPTISVYIAETGEKKEMKMEEYIKGVVAAEMEPSWPLEALAAQAILARTFTMERIESTGGVPSRGTDASTSVEEFQAYDAKRINDNVIQAVDKTRGLVVKHQGKMIKAWFFADGGGQTAASAEEGLAYTKEPSPYVHSVKDPGSEITIPENKSWRVEFPIAQVRTAVQKAIGQDPGSINQVAIEKKGPSGRVVSFSVGKLTLSGPGLRLALGSEKMRSTLVTEFRLSGGKLVVAGKGFGHGVGMSQWGARALAEQGKSAQDIVSYFYQGVQISRAWK